MKYSIVVPVYNVRPYLEACVTSVFEQTHGDYEVILVDDGSTDGSGALCDFFEKQHSGKVVALHKENGGALAARQFGIANATGDVVVFLDGDDCLRADALQRLEEVFLREKCDMVIYDFSRDSDFQTAGYLQPFADGTCFEGRGKAELYQVMTLSSSLNSLCVKAVRRNVLYALPDYSGLTGIVNGEDLLCSLPMVTESKKIVYLKQNLYYYRPRQGSVVHTFNPNRSDSIKTVHQEFERYIDLWQMPQLHAKHYAREVKGWIETLEMLLKNLPSVASQNRKTELIRLAEEPYFRNAYARMDVSVLSKRTRILAECLYHKNYAMILLFGNILRLGSGVKRKINRKV